MVLTTTLDIRGVGLLIQGAWLDERRPSGHPFAAPRRIVRKENGRHGARTWGGQSMTIRADPGGRSGGCLFL